MLLKGRDFNGLLALMMAVKGVHTAERGQILVRIGHERSYRYRFADPMMQPYVIMKGVEQGLIDPKALEVLSSPAQLQLPTI